MNGEMADQPCRTSTRAGRDKPIRRLDNPVRAVRLIESAIRTFQLDLTGITVLTEAASGPFVCTALLAAMAGGRVIAVARTSPYGPAEDVIDYCEEWARLCQVGDSIVFSDRPSSEHADRAEIVTNLGFVRPISDLVVSRLPSHAAIPLMWEPWEFRPDDLDLAACRRRGIPVVGTRECDARLRIFEYVGVLALKLLLESGLEVFRTSIGIIGSDPFGSAIERALKRAGAETRRLPLPHGDRAQGEAPGAPLTGLEALVLAEHRDRRELVGTNGGIDPVALARGGVQLIHIAGTVDDNALRAAGLAKLPNRPAPPGVMTATTDYVGPRPVVDLHCAGLKVGEILVRALRAGATAEEAERAAVRSGLGARLNAVA